MRYLKYFAAVLALLVLLSGCAKAPTIDIAVTTAPVAQFTAAVTEGTGLILTQIVTDNVSCLHDYTLSVGQMEAIASARITILSGGGLEDSMSDALAGAYMTVNCGNAVSPSEDPHYWLDPAQAAEMVDFICKQLSQVYPTFAPVFQMNSDRYKAKLADLEAYGRETLAGLDCPGLLTFHDGFGHFAKAFGLEIAAAVEEEDGSEISAAKLTEMVELVNTLELPALFTEVNSPSEAAQVIAGETGAKVYALDLAMGGTDYLEAMYRNIDTVKEAFS